MERSKRGRRTEPPRREPPIVCLGHLRTTMQFISAAHRKIVSRSTLDAPSWSLTRLVTVAERRGATNPRRPPSGAFRPRPPKIYNDAIRRPKITSGKFRRRERMAGLSIAVRHAPFGIHHPPSVICHPPSGICHLPSAIWHPDRGEVTKSVPVESQAGQRKIHNRESARIAYSASSGALI